MGRDAHRLQMCRHRVVDIFPIATGHRNGYRQAVRAGRLHDLMVSRRQSLQAEFETPETIPFMRISASQIDDQLRRKTGKHGR